jgi:hypothetical protein
MANHPNIEKSLFKPDEYVGYDGRGYPWRVMKITPREWRAVPGASHPYRDTAPRLTDKSLTAIAHKLASRGAAIAAE